MATRNKKKLAALNKENCEEHPRSNLAQNWNVLRSEEDYITQVSEEIEERVTKRLPKEFSRTENRMLGALARLDDFLMIPLIQGHSGTTPEPSQNALSTSPGTNEDDSQNDPHPEAGLFHGQMTQNSGPEDGHDNNICYFYARCSVNDFILENNNIPQATTRHRQLPATKHKKRKLPKFFCHKNSLVQLKFFRVSTKIANQLVVWTTVHFFSHFHGINLRDVYFSTSYGEEVD